MVFLYDMIARDDFKIKLTFFNISHHVETHDFLVDPVGVSSDNRVPFHSFFAFSTINSTKYNILEICVCTTIPRDRVASEIKTYLLPVIFA